jgi:hypothetical protein
MAMAAFPATARGASEAGWRTKGVFLLLSLEVDPTEVFGAPLFLEVVEWCVEL